jgi:uncharacterized cupredoxin-like copper-binding protein
VRFLIANDGQVLHEMVLGTLEELKKHAQAMKESLGMAHDEPYMVSPCARRERRVRVADLAARDVYYACLVPGHFEAGMVGKVVVTR